MMDNNSAEFGARHRGEEGKSLVEIAIVVMIIAVVIAMALPAVANSIRSYNLRSAAARVAERLAGARALAMAKNKNVTVAFTTDGSGNVTQYGFDFTPAGAPDGTPDSIDPDDPMQSYYVETPPSGITATFVTGGTTLTNGKGIAYTSRGELPIGASLADIRLTNSSGLLTVSINLRGQVWVH
jgi:Tfp pilus assembly protein FimT